MSDNATEKTKIKIVKVDGGDVVDAASLMGCYFEAPDSRDIYQFFGEGDNPIPTIPEFLTLETPAFQFIRAGMLWTISALEIDQVAETANGRWSNPRHPSKGDDEGHFQAQAGPPLEVSASSATA